MPYALCMLLKSVGTHLQAVITENYPVFFSFPCWWSDPILTHMYHICIIYVSYMCHICTIYDPYVLLCGWLVNGKKGGEKEIELQLPDFEAWLPCLTLI